MIPTRAGATRRCWCASGSVSLKSDFEVIDFLLARYGESRLLELKVDPGHAVAVVVAAAGAGRR